MLRASLDRLLRELPDDAVVLDLGGWGRPLARADWVIDLMPWATRGLYGRDGEGPERFSKETWIERDLCDRDPYPFEDGELDFVVCSHTLEDVRDPVWVCAEMARVGKAGYIEAPSRLEEQSYGVQGPWVGWGHHRWLVEVADDGALELVMKHHVMHGRASDHFPAGFHERLSDEERVVTLWWEGAFGFRERVMLEAAELDAYLADFVARELSARSGRRAGSERLTDVVRRALRR
jgi:hypothetical protein